MQKLPYSMVRYNDPYIVHSRFNRPKKHIRVRVSANRERDWKKKLATKDSLQPVLR